MNDSETTSETTTNETQQDYAIIRYAGKNFQVEEGKTITLPVAIDEAQNNEVVFDEVLMLKSGETCIVGSPLVEGAKVTGKVLCNKRDAKIIVFKKKRRKGYRLKQGHRAPLCEVQIDSLVASAR